MASEAWPVLGIKSWKATYDTVHLYSQIPGKIRLALSPAEPEFNHVTLYVAPRGLTTGPIPYGDRSFQMDFDFISHAFVIAVSDGQVKSIDLQDSSVAKFYASVMNVLRDCRIDVHITDVPQEVPDPIPFTKDERHASYDQACAEALHRALVIIDNVFNVHRAPFRGRHTPVQLWWGGFDLGYERFSGRPATPPPGSNRLYRLSMDAELINAGFWFGDARFPEPAFYSYTYPKPDGIEAAKLKPASAYWNQEIGLFLLRYEDVRRSALPRDTLLEFLASTYDAGATLAKWDPAFKDTVE